MGALEDKVAVITGAGRGIGREEALLMAAEGAKVVVNDLGGEWDGTGSSKSPADQVVKEIKEAGGEAVANYESVTDFQGAKRILDCAIDTFGKLDILVNNAGFLRDRMIFNMSEEEFDAVIAVHLKGHFNCGRWACSYFREQKKGGRIINTSSAAGLIGNVGQTNYAAAKAGIALMTKAWSMEMQKYQVTCNAIAPIARTRMTEGTFGDAFSTQDQPFDSLSPANIAPLVAFLASDYAKDITGIVFGVKGGDIEVWEYSRAGKSMSIEAKWTVSGIRERIGEIL